MKVYDYEYHSIIISSFRYINMPPFMGEDMRHLRDMYS
jgi:hypothetical protein